ncbi:MAG: phage terminase large subunit [Cyclobacteriaceae bacterium]
MTIDFSKYYQAKPKQEEAHRNRARYLLFGGAMGGGKSFFLCAKAVKNAMKFSGNRLVIIRKELSVARRTIVTTFFKICPPEIIANFNKSSLEVTFINGSKLFFLEADVGKDPLLNKLKGLEIGWFGIDEANEISKEVYDILKTRLRWILPDGSTPRYEGRLTSNPENCWLIPSFIHSNSSDEVYIQSLTSDNFDPNSDYYKSLEEAYKDNPQLLSRYLLGDWSLTDSIDQLIPTMAINGSEVIVNANWGDAIGIDVARYGSDQTVFIVLKDGNIDLIETYAKTSIPQVASKAMELMNTYNINPEYCGIDGVGIGAGVIDILKSNGYYIQDLVGGSKPVETGYEESFKPNNLRSQMYYQLRKDLIEHRIGNLINAVLKRELTHIKYEVSTEKTVRVMSKDAIRKTLGKSPDLADALCYCNWVREPRGTPGGLPVWGGG